MPQISPAEEGFAAGAVQLNDSIFSGERDAVVVWVKPPEPLEKTVGQGYLAAISEGVALIVEEGKLILSVGPVALGQAILSWDGIDGLATTVQATSGLGDFDITNGGTQEGIALEVASNDKAANVSVVLFSDKDNSSEMTSVIPVTSTPIVVNYPFDDFARNGNGATLTDIEAIVLYIGSGGGVSGPEVIEIDSIHTY